MRYDVAIIGGGIIGTSAAAFLAQAGRSVVLVERESIAAGASGRNSGVLQHPYDPLLARLHRRAVELYLELAESEPDFEVGAQPAGLLMVGPDGEELREACRLMALDHPDLSPQHLSADELRRLEPSIAEGMGACRLATGHPVVPAAATMAYARTAERSGAVLRLGSAAQPWLSGDEVRGVALDGGERLSAGQVLIAAGPWSPALVPGWQAAPPIRSTYGVVVSTRLNDPPGHVLEELGIDPASSGVPTSFSLVTAGGPSSVGSTFLDERPVAEELQAMLLRNAARFVPAIEKAEPIGVRVCARPVSFDGRPLIGAVESIEGLFVCAGHGPWGMSTGPATARLIADVMLGRPASDGSVPAALRAERAR